MTELSPEVQAAIESASRTAVDDMLVRLVDVFGTPEEIRQWRASTSKALADLKTDLKKLGRKI